MEQLGGSDFEDKKNLFNNFMEGFLDKLNNLEGNTDIFWKKLDKVKFELFDYKNEIENINNDLTLSMFKSKEIISNSRIEKFEMGKKNKNDYKQTNKTPIIYNGKQILKTVEKTTNNISSNYNTENKILDIDIELTNKRDSNAKLKASNSHSPPKKSKMTIKFDTQLTTNGNSHNSISIKMKKSTVENANAEKQIQSGQMNMHTNNFKPLKMDNSPFVKKIGQGHNQGTAKTNTNISAFSPVISKKEMGLKHFGGSSSAYNSEKSVNRMGYGSRLKDHPKDSKESKDHPKDHAKELTSPSTSTSEPYRKIEDPKQIEINLDDDVDKITQETETYVYVNNKNNILINTNEEE